MNSVVKLEHKDVDAIPFQEASLDIWDKKYRLSAKDGTPVDKTMDDTYKRVARALADVELEPVREQWYERFVWALRRGAIPAGRVTSNAGVLPRRLGGAPLRYNRMRWCLLRGAVVELVGVIEVCRDKVAAETKCDL